MNYIAQYELAKAIQRDRLEEACQARLALSARGANPPVAKQTEQQR